MRKIVPAFLIFITAFATSKTFAQAGSLDSSFGVNGRKTNAIANGNDNYFPYDFPGLAIQNDGKIVIAIEDEIYDDANTSHLLIVRFNANGFIDSSFGKNGIILTAFDSGSNTGSVSTSIKILQNGKILVGGWEYHPFTGGDQYILARYLANGQLDFSFGINGKEQDYISGHSGTAEDYLLSLALQNDGKIIGGGYSDGYCLVRYKPNGGIDSSFGVNGKWIDSFYDAYSPYGIRSFDILQNGNFITGLGPTGGGTFSPFPWNDFIINRVLSNGVTDSTFGTNGFASIDFFGDDDELKSIAIVNNGVIAGGYVQDPASSNIYLALTKLNNNGHIITSFGNNGKVTLPVSTSLQNFLKIFIQADGKILAVGSIMARFNADGSVDSAFGINGIANNFISSIAAVQQSDQKVIALSNPLFTLSRYQNDLPVISINNITVSEGNAGTTNATFKLSLDKASAQSVTVAYTTKDGSAKQGSDYTAKSATVTFNAGQLHKNVVIKITGDTVKERTEKFYLMLSNPVNAGIKLKDSGICTITNDDMKLIGSAEKATTTEENKTTVYPDPAKDNINIQISASQNETAQIEIVSMEGKIISSINKNISEGTSTQTINIASLAAGSYFIKIKTSEGEKTEKFVKE